MFFPRLRRHAKWMFVLLALVFGLGFVVFGVGAGGTGVGDIFRGSGGSSGPSVSSTRKATEERPKDPQAWRDYATALETEGNTAEAIVALNTAIDLNPKDANAYRELAGSICRAPPSGSAMRSSRRSAQRSWHRPRASPPSSARRAGMRSTTPSRTR